MTITSPAAAKPARAMPASCGWKARTTWSPTATCCISGLRPEAVFSVKFVVMPKLHWEDFKLGAVAVYGPRLVTREEIVAFAAEFDPQPMHLDEAAASATMLGGLGASGWHTCCLLRRMIADGFIPVSYTHLRAHETDSYLVCRLLL